MGNFKVGDKVEVVANGHGGHEVGTKGKIIHFDGSDLSYEVESEKGEPLWHTDEELKLVESKPSKKQRIETLEKEVSELKLIVHELRERKPSVFATAVGQDLEAEYAEQVKDEPSTDNIVEDKQSDVIEFEGQQYRKVGREAVVGDVVSFQVNNTSPEYSVVNKPYLVTSLYEGKPHFEGDNGIEYHVYAKEHNRTTETVIVYEPINQPVQRQTVPCSATRPPIEEVGEAFFEAANKVLNPKTANELRGEIISKAIDWVDENGGDDYYFEINEEERTVFCWKLIKLNGRNDVQVGLATCHPNDVFNTSIGRAIALGRAEKLDVSEFEQAVQPNEYAIGQIGINEILGFSKQYEITKIGKGDVFKKLFEPFDSAMGDTTKPLFYMDNTHKALTIINDTNAIYGGVE